MFMFKKWCLYWWSVNSHEYKQEGWSKINRKRKFLDTYIKVIPNGEKLNKWIELQELAFRYYVRPDRIIDKLKIAKKSIMNIFNCYVTYGETTVAIHDSFFCPDHSTDECSHLKADELDMILVYLNKQNQRRTDSSIEKEIFSLN